MSLSKASATCAAGYVKVAMQADTTQHCGITDAQMALPHQMLAGTRLYQDRGAALGTMSMR